MSPEKQIQYYVDEAIGKGYKISSREWERPLVKECCPLGAISISRPDGYWAYTEVAERILKVNRAWTCAFTYAFDGGPNWRLDLGRYMVTWSSILAWLVLKLMPRSVLAAYVLGKKFRRRLLDV